LFLGLGFNIKGGIDLQVFPGDSSIYVATVKPGGAAARDRRLQEGDKIVEVQLRLYYYICKNEAVLRSYCCN